MSFIEADCGPQKLAGIAAHLDRSWFAQRSVVSGGILALGLVLATSCAAYSHWSKTGATDADLQRDIAACEENGEMAFSSPPGSFAAAAIRRGVYRCMTQRGWTPSN